MSTETATAIDTGLRARRETVVYEHIRAETSQDLDGLIATFEGGPPSYDVVALGVTHDGEEAVRDLIGELMAGFPDLDLAVQLLHHADDAVIVEGRMTGTHEAEWGGMAATGRRMDMRAAVFFRFDGDRLTNETVYFDTATLEQQLQG